MRRSINRTGNNSRVIKDPVISKEASGKKNPIANAHKESEDQYCPNEKSQSEKHRGIASYAAGLSQIVTLNTYPNGISLTVHRTGEGEAGNGEIIESTSPAQVSYQAGYHRDPFFLRTRETRDYAVPEGKFLVYRDNIKLELEEFFRALSKKGLLASTGVYLGVFTDAFHGFHKKFAQTMACLDTIERFQPAQVVVQSRSRMLLTALPLLKSMRSRAHCVIPFESRLERSVQRYTPGQPRLEERLVTAAGLRAQGVEVTLSASPLLPYGSTSGDTWKFAELLVRYSDKILLQPLCTGDRQEELILRNLPLANKLEVDGELRLLRPGAHDELRAVIGKLSPSHLEIPEFQKQEPQQLKLFAA